MEALIIIIILFIILILLTNVGKNHPSQPKYDGISSGSIQKEILFNTKVGYNINGKSPQKGIDEYEWVPLDTPVSIKNYTIKEGLFYVGKRLTYKQNDLYANEPSLINPSLKINPNNPDYFGTGLNYWPSYSYLSPESKAAYLSWLSQGRSTSNTPIGYVFLFFYGLERRLLIDLEKEPNIKESKIIIYEAEKLLSIYGNNSSFHSYVVNFIDFAKSLFVIEKIELPIKNTAPWGEFPLSFKFILMDYAVQSKPLPASIALKWLEYDSTTYFRTPAQRCKSEFESLFTIRFNEKYKNSLILKPNNINITANYMPASAALPRPIIREYGDSPDLTKSLVYIEQFKQIAFQCEHELESYSRYLGRNPGEGKSIAAITLLPKALINKDGNKQFELIKNDLLSIIKEQQFSIIDTNYLLELLSLKLDDKLNKTEIINLIQLLEKIEIGIEPDIRFGSLSLKSNGKVVLFPIDENFPVAPTKEYSASLLIITLSTILSAADGHISEEEKQQIVEHIESSLDLSKEDRIRLTAFMNWAALSAIDMKGVNQKISELSIIQKSHLANFLITLANADGYISPEEINTLKKIYKVFEFDENKLYNDINNIQAGTQYLPIIIPARASKGDYKIPKPRKQAKQINLDQKLVEKTLKDTYEVQKILTSIFIEEEAILTDSHSYLSNKDKRDNILGLDYDHTLLLKELLKKSTWERNEFEDLCKRYGLLSNGAMENINETFYENLGEDLLIEEDGIEINSMIFNKTEDYLPKITENVYQEIKLLESIYKLSINLNIN